MRRQAAALTELRRALWRHEYGQLPSRRIKRLLRLEYLRATRELAALEPGVPAMRRYDPELLRDRDAFRARADAAIRGERFRDAVREILRGRTTLAAMRELVDASGRVEAAAEAVRWLQERASTPRIRALPCVAAPTRLLALAHEYLERKEYAQAAYLASTSLVESAPLEQREGAAPERAARLETRFAEIRTMCAETRAISGDVEGDPLADGSLDAVAALARDGLMALAERVADELAFSLAARGRFHRELRRAGAAEAEDASLLRGALAAAGGEEPWSSATAALWRSRVETGLRRADVQRERLDRARDLLRLDARPPERSNP